MNTFFSSLNDNIIDVIKEEQIKLGFQRETLRLYYPMRSLQHLLNVESSVNELKNVLKQFCLSVKDTLGDVVFTVDETNRFCIIIPPEGVVYVHKEVKDRTFLAEFIHEISRESCNIDSIKAIFQQYSGEVSCEKVDHGEFDYLLYFKNGIPDQYRYCIKFEGCHTIYHRFTIFDYEDFNF